MGSLKPPCCFPQELFDLIVDKLWDDFSALCACNTTCRRLRLRARAHLYRSVVLSDLCGNESTLGRLRLFYADAAEPWIPWHSIKHLELIIYAESDDVWGSFIDSLSGSARDMGLLEDLVLKGDGGGIPTHWLPLITALHKACSSIQYLDMEHSCDWQVWQLAHIISGFPALQHLAMPEHIRPHSHPTEQSIITSYSQAPSVLRSISLSANGPWDLESAGVLVDHLGNNIVSYILFVDSFFLLDLFVQPGPGLAMQYDAVKAISVDAKVEDSHIEHLLDAFPYLQFLCINVRLDQSYYDSDAQPRTCTLVSAAVRTVEQLAARPAATLNYLSIALHFPAKQGLTPNPTLTTRLRELCEILSEPYARHIHLIVICVLDADGLSGSEILGIERFVENHLAERCASLESPKRWTSIVTRGGETSERDWGNLAGMPMQKLMSACISGRFHT